ncbi:MULTISPECIES: hypothetical protein [unclassified Ruegeria]|uniref:hypothetical protein n=1 Tax=unclassified Ruegeria TaxID=2625375 RepID=UPI0014876C5E|nr:MULTISPECIES: hypothetical protein [unclassified Ruegeria]
MPVFEVRLSEQSFQKVARFVLLGNFRVHHCESLTWHIAVELAIETSPTLLLGQPAWMKLLHRPQPLVVDVRINATTVRP